MLTSAFHTSPRHFAIVAMACLCVLLGGPSYAAGAESLIIANATYCEPGVSGPGWAWTDAGHLELNGYAGEAIGADGDLVVTLTGQNTAVETSAPDVDISRCGMEVWGDLTLRGTGSLTATGSQCGIYVAGALAVDGCKVDARADGAGIADARVAGVIAGSLTVRGGARVMAVGDCPVAGVRDGEGLAAAGSGAIPGVRAYGVYLLDGETGDCAAGLLAVNASWLDATGADTGVACLGGLLTSAHFVTPEGGAFGASSVVDADGAVAVHVMVEPVGSTVQTGETDAREVPDNGGSSVMEPAVGPTTGPTLMPVAAATKTTTTVTKTTAAMTSKPSAATAISSTLPKTSDSNLIAASTVLFLLGITFLCAAQRC